MSRFQGRPQTCGPISDSADITETLGQLLEFTDRARAGWVLDTSALYATVAFCREDTSTDAIIYAEDNRSHLPNDALREAADQIIQKPDTVACQALSDHGRGWLLTADAAKADRKTVAVVQDAIQRADLYLAAFGHAASCLRAAVHAYEHARRESNPVLHARTIAVALALLDRAHGLGDGTRMLIPMTSREWIEQAMHRLHISSSQFDEYEHARKTLVPRQDKAAPISDLLSDLPDADDTPRVPDVDVASDLDAILDVEIAGRPIIERQPLPTIVVLQSLSHLPDAKSSQQSNPKLEFASMAGVYMPLAEAPNLQEVSRILIAEMPWAEDVIMKMLMDSVGSTASRVQNTLLVGKPGSGKTRLARRLGETLGMQPTVVAAAGAADASFGGTSRQWSTSRASVPLQAIRRTGIANPLIVIDELEKAGSGDHNGRLTDVLLPFLEPESSRRYHDPYVECAADLSKACYIATANASFRLSGPLLDRFRMIEVPQPRRQDLPIVVRTILSEIRQERNEDELWLPGLDGGEMEILARQWRDGSLRPLKRMVETLIAGRMAFAPRH